MEYTKEQIISENSEYLGLCKRFYDLAKSDEQKKVLEEILNEGKYGDFYFSSGLYNKDNSNVEMKRRISMADLFLRTPETFETIIQNRVNLFHGTNANALPSILKYGLNSMKKSEEMEISVTTGEEWSRSSNPRSFVSFTDLLEVAEYYSATEGDDKLSFEVIIGTTTDEVTSVGVAHGVSSDVVEIGVKSSMPIESIKVIMVPKDKIDYVRKLVNNDQIIITPINDFNNKFYYYDALEPYDTINIDENLFEQHKQGILEEEKTKLFDIEEIKNVSKTRLLSKIKEQIDKFKTILMKDGEFEYEGRTI